MKSIQQKIDEELQKIKELPPCPDITDDSIDSISLGDDNMFGINDLSTYTLNDDWIIKPLDLGNLSVLLGGAGSSGASGSIAIGGTGGSGTLGIGGGGSGYHNSTYTTTANPTYSWNTLNQPAQVHITSRGIEMDEDADITIGGRSMKKLLESVEQRLSILVPDPKKLKQYEALQQAYEHYKTLEALCNEEPKKDQQ